MENISFDGIVIVNEKDLSTLVNNINTIKFARKFKFETKDIKNRFLKEMGIDISNFEKNYYFYNKKIDLHISESEFNYLWISNIGVVGHTNCINNFYSSLRSQNIVIDLLFKEALKLCNQESSYDIDSYSYGYLSELTPAIFHNVLFYFELFGKTYLSLSEVDFPNTHKLEKILNLLKQTMFKLNHNNTIFHARIVKAFEDIVKHIETIPGNFKEQYVKYFDNVDDSTTISFDEKLLTEIKSVIDMSYDFISHYYYNKEEPIYLKCGLFERLCNKTKNEVDLAKIKQTYSYLVEIY